MTFFTKLSIDYNLTSCSSIDQLHLYSTIYSILRSYSSTEVLVLHKGVSIKIFRGEGESIKTEPVLTTKNKRFFQIWDVEASPCKDLSHFIGLQSALQIIHHQQMLQSRLCICHFTKKQTCSIYSTIIRINLFESNKTFAIKILHRQLLYVMNFRLICINF